MATNPCFRTATTADLSALADLVTGLGYNSDADRIEQTLAQIRAQQGEVFVAEIDGRVVGCVNAVIDVRLAAGLWGEIASLTVCAEYRGKGVGSGLVAHAEAWLAERVGQLRIRANRLRHRAHGFYSGLGYSEKKEQKVFVKQL